MGNINAAIGLAQLKKVDQFISRRREICKKYNSAFKSETNVSLLPINYDTVAPHIYVIRVLNNKRDQLMQFLKDRDIETAINYVPNHLHSFYKDSDLNLPITHEAFKEI